jgi:hypothetical protein
MIYLCHDRATRLTKIGLSEHTLSREKSLRLLYPASEFVLVFNGGRKLEMQLHQRYAEHRIFGEWFDLPGAVVEALGDEFEDQLDYEARR